MRKYFIILLLIIFGCGFFCSQNIVFAAPETVVHFFYGTTCPHCKKMGEFLNKLQEENSNFQIYGYEVYGNKQNADLLLKIFGSRADEMGVTVPVIVIGEKAIVGYLSDDTTGKQIETAINKCVDEGCADVLRAPDKISDGDSEAMVTKYDEENNGEWQIISIPFIGHIDISKMSLPVLTIIMGALDGFNPCAMWVLLFLLALLINTRSRKRMWLIAGTFILTSGVVYFLILSAWLNFFLVISYVNLTRIIIGIFALIIGVWQMKNFITYQPGVCKVLGIKSKMEKKIKDRVEKVAKAPIVISTLLGIVFLAFAVNLIEFFCSAGLPAIYARVLTLSQLGLVAYYSYLLLYVVVFMADDLIIFSLAIVTLNKIGFTEKYGRWATLIGAVLILALGFLMLLKPELLMF